MSAESPYLPIDCSFHDRLEAQAVLRQRCRLRFEQGDGTIVAEEGRIVDIQTREGAEYLRMESGTVVRLDRIVALEGLP